MNINKIEKLILIKKDLDYISTDHLDYLSTFLLGNIDNIKNDDDEYIYSFTRPNHDNITKDLYSGKFSTTFALYSILNTNLSLNEIEVGLSKKEISKITEKLLKEFPDEDVNQIRIKSEDQIKEKIETGGIIQNYVKLLKDSSGKSWWMPSFEESFDIYTSSFKLLCFSYALKKLKDQKIPQYVKKLDKFIILALSNIIKNLDSENNPSARFSDKHDVSAFLSYWCITALYEWRELLPENDEQIHKSWKEVFNSEDETYDFCIHHPRKKDTHNIKLNIQDYPTKIKVDNVFHKIQKWAKNEIDILLSFYAANDFEHTDPVRSIFCLAIHKKYLDIHQKKLFIEPKYSGNISDLKMDKIFTFIFEEQQSFGLWKKYKPALSIPSNDGNVYPFALSTFCELIKITNITDDLFELFVSGIQNAIEWIKRNKQETQEYLVRTDTRTFKPVGSFSGWRSVNSSNPKGNPEAWSTALVFDSVNIIKHKVDYEITKEIVSFYGGMTPNELEKGYRWIPKDILYKKNMVKCDETFPKMIKSIFIESKSVPNANICYGPPGTGKSELPKYIAREKGWCFIRIDTSVLLKNEINNTATTINEVFKYLNQIKNTVILFDEIDEFIRDRHNKEFVPDFHNRILTNMLLTKLNDLKLNSKIIYFVNTNHINTIDPAITRPGRFDNRFYIGVSKDIIEKYGENIDENIKSKIFDMNDPDIMNFDKDVLSSFIEYSNYLINTDGEGIKDTIKKFKEEKLSNKG